MVGKSVSSIVVPRFAGARQIRVGSFTKRRAINTRTQAAFSAGLLIPGE